MNKEFHKRINDIAKRIDLSQNAFNLDSESDVLSILENDRSNKIENIHNVLNLIFSLLNKKHLFSRAFWKSYADSFSANPSFYSELDVADIKNILETLDKASSKNPHIKKPFNKLLSFISINGLLRDASLRHIESETFLEILPGQSAIGIQKRDSEISNRAVQKAKTHLFRFLCFYYGINFLSGVGVDRHLNPLTSEELDYLKKIGLVGEPKNIFKQRYKDYLENEWSGYDYPAQEIKFGFREIVSRINFEAEVELVMYSRPDFSQLLMFNTANALNKDIDSFMNQYNHRMYISNAIIFAFNIVDRYTSLRESLLSKREDFLTWDPKSLSLLAGLSNPKTIKNELLKPDSILLGKVVEKGSSSDRTISAESAEEWLKHKQRKYKFHEPLNNSVDKDLTFQDIKVILENLNDSKKVIEFSPDDKFVRTNKEISPGVAMHNKKRWEWIGKDGKTFSELLKPNSIYRQNIKRITYTRKQGSSIKQDIIYDIKNGWIKKVND